MGYLLLNLLNEPFPVLRFEISGACHQNLRAAFLAQGAGGGIHAAVHLNQTARIDFIQPPAQVSGFFHPTVMGKTEWFKSNLYSEWALRAEDFELWTRSERNSVFYSIENPLLFYREFGVPTFKKYYLSQITLIRIARRYTFYNKSL